MIDIGQEQGPIIEDGLRLVNKPEDITIKKVNGASIFKSPLVTVPELGLKGFGLSIVEFTENDIKLDVEDELNGLAIGGSGEVKIAPLKEMLQDGYGLVDVGSYADQEIANLAVEVWSAKHPSIKASASLTNQGFENVGSPDLALDGGMTGEWNFSGAEADNNVKFVVKQDVASMMDLRVRLTAKPISSKDKGGES